MTPDERIAYLGRAIDDLRTIALDQQDRITLLENTLADLLGTGVNLVGRLELVCAQITAHLDGLDDDDAKPS